MVGFQDWGFAGSLDSLNCKRRLRWMRHLAAQNGSIAENTRQGRVLWRPAGLLSRQGAPCQAYEYMHLSSNVYIYLCIDLTIDLSIFFCPCIHLSAYLPTYVIHACTYHSCIHACIHSFVRSSIHPFIHSSIHPSIHPSMHSFIHASIHSFIHYFIIFPSFIRCNTRTHKHV